LPKVLHAGYHIHTGELMHRTGYIRIILVLFLTTGLILSSCRTQVTPTPSPTDTPEPLPTATEETTPEPTATATPEPLGSPGNPLVIGFIAENPPSSANSSFDQIAGKLTSATGYTFISQTYFTYPDLLAAFDDGNVHLAWLPPVTYLVARQRGLVDVLQVTNHFGRYAYGSQFLAHVDSGFTPYFDVIANQNTADAGSALAQFAGKRPCLTEPTSVSGFLLPLGILASQSVPTLPAVVTQTQGAVIRSLYIKDICDFGATFALSGDPRTASGIQQSLPDVLSKVIVIWRSEAVIPSYNVSVMVDVPQAIRQTLNDALLSLVKTPKGKALLTEAVAYDIQDLKPVNDDFYNPLRGYLQAANVDIETLVGK
jgi:phosphonate transport system substrate-binding protein